MKTLLSPLAVVLTLLFASSAVDAQRPFEYTEEREPCDDYAELKQPFFGVLHQHTGLSFDAALRFVRGRPRDAYRFAQGKGIMKTPDQFGINNRTTKLHRPIDFLGITDHSETFGEMGICLNNANDSDAPGRQSLECAMLTGFLDGPRTAPLPELARTGSSAAFTLMAISTFLSANFGMHLPMCYANPEECEDAELDVWREMQRAANHAYDTTSACEFTTFIAYENTSMPAGVTQHRNVIFRNDDVIERPISAIDISRRANPHPQYQITPPSLVGNPDPTKLWRGLEEECNDAPGRCEALVIPHNTNLSSRLGITRTVMSIPGKPEDRQENIRLMKKMQPLIEIYQVKGASECRYDPRFRRQYERDNTLYMIQTGLAEEDVHQPGEPDEYCAFELLDSKGGGAAAGLAGGAKEATPPSAWSPRAYVRNVLKDGLKLEEKYGQNPFQLGIGASQDDHNARPGFVVENARFNGHTGVGDAFPTRDAGTIQNSPGGLWVAWAEENSRDSIFTSLKRKETYGTSGTRPKVRFFGGWKYPKKACEKNLTRIGYKKGVAMGGTLRRRVHNRAPRFIAAAWKDDGADGTDLQRIQIVKGWLDESGDTHEAVFDVAVTDGPGAQVHDVPIPNGQGSEHLCTVWEDPQFDPAQRAFYYARVLETPVPRYTTDICQQANVNPYSPKCKEQLEEYKGDLRYPFAYENYSQCCSKVGKTPQEIPLVERAIQERAWTSPIWYSPQSGD